MTTKKQTAGNGSAEETAAMSFEKAIERLEAIVAEMEGGHVNLEKMIEHFEEGQKLIAFCSKKLNEIERRVEILVKKGDTTTTEPFDESDAVETPEKKQAKGGGKDAGELF